MRQRVTYKKALSIRTTEGFILSSLYAASQHRLDQPLRILRLRILNDLFRCPFLFHMSVMHHDHPVAEHLNKGQVVADKKEGQLFFLKCEEADAPTGTMVQGNTARLITELPEKEQQEIRQIYAS